MAPPPSLAGRTPAAGARHAAWRARAARPGAPRRPRGAQAPRALFFFSQRRAPPASPAAPAPAAPPAEAAEVAPAPPLQQPQQPPARSRPPPRQQRPSSSSLQRQRAQLESRLGGEQQQQAGQAPQPGLSERIQRLLPWAALPMASTLDGAAAAGAADAAADGDGMAAPLDVAAAVRAAAAPPRRRRTGAPVPAPPAPPVIQAGHPALQVLRARALAGSRPGRRADGFKLGLVVEGGGMRGCVSGGALQALAELGLRDAFDAVYGASAGAINATYFLSGQRDGVEIYHDHIASPEFIDLRRLWAGRLPGGPGAAAGAPLPPVLNLDFLLGRVMHEVHPLDWDAVLASPVPLKVVASSLDALRPVLLSDFSGKDDLLQSLRASACVPEIAGAPVEHRGQRLVDAAVFEAVPFMSAVADGCTHVVVLCTRPARPRRASLNAALADAVEAAIKKAVLSPAYMVPAWEAEVRALVRDGLSQDEMLLRALEDGAEALPWFAGAHVFPLYPGPAAAFSPLCLDVPTLKGGIAEGRRCVTALARAVLGDALGGAAERAAAGGAASNVVPAPRRAAAPVWAPEPQRDLSTRAA